MEDSWARCSTCKGDIGFGEGYYVCSVSTCNRKDSNFRFCSVECWDAHVPTMRHREAWAEEATAPSRGQWERENPPKATAPPAPRSTGTSPSAAAPRPSPTGSVPPPGFPPPQLQPAEREVLVVVSKLKAYVRARSGMNTSDSVLEVLSDKVRELCDDAILNASSEGRKTVMDRDF